MVSSDRRLPSLLFRGDSDPNNERHLREYWNSGWLQTNLGSEGRGSELFQAPLVSLIEKHVNGDWPKTHFLSFTSSRTRAAAGTSAGGPRVCAGRLACPGSVGTLPAVALAGPRLSIPVSSSGIVHRRSGTGETHPRTGGSDGRRGPYRGSEPAGLDFFSAPCDPRPRLVDLSCTGAPSRARSG